MNGSSVVRIGVLVVSAIACVALAVTTHLVVASLLGPVGGVLAGVVVGMLLGSVVWVGAVLAAPRTRSGDGVDPARRAAGVR